jgi:hypothetical protein
VWTGLVWLRIGTGGEVASVACYGYVPSSPILVTLMMEGLSSSETSVLTSATGHNIPEDAILHSHRSENLESYLYNTIIWAHCCQNTAPFIGRKIWRSREQEFKPFFYVREFAFILAYFFHSCQLRPPNSRISLLGRNGKTHEFRFTK